MRLDVDITKAKPEIVASHKGKALVFTANIFTRKPFSETDVYKEINAYWADQPESLQDAIFDVYGQVNQGFEEIFVSEDLTDWLRRCIAELYRLTPLEGLRDWLVKNNIRIPSSVKDLPPAMNDVINTADKTYTRPEYIDLISLAMFLRVITPIWGEYIGSVRRDTGVSRKEYVGMQLLIDTGVLESEPMKKLMLYISKLTQPIHEDECYIINNFSSDDIVFLFVSLTCIRKICVADISGEDDVSSIVSVMFKFIRHRINSVDTHRIIVKKENAGDSDSGKHSLLESYRKRIELSSGEKAELTFMLSQPIKIAKYIQPDIDENLLLSCMSTASVLKYEEISDVQLHLVGALIKPCITPSSVFYVDSEIHAGLLGAMEAVLWARGHRYLAIMISSRLIQNVEEVTISNLHSREQIPIEIKTELLKWFPFFYGYVKKVKDSQTIAQQAYDRSDILTSIDHIVDELANSSLRASASEDKLISVFGEVKRRLPVFSNVRRLIAEALIDNEQRIAAIPKEPFYLV